MKFKGIEIYGFKSFADKASIQFLDGVTAVVGPNGCGKSNVVDAIRWVLGEQSARVLRGKTMQDVIFSGTMRRKALSYCEVSLIFNNEGPDRVFETLPFDEVTISRKLFRNGNSEYYINKEPVKLRDVRTIIRETGLGREGYSIVGQGKVDEIIKAKPENRRAIFEDAAGVLTNKVSKRDAEHNLEAYRVNKKQLELLLAEIESRLTPLRKQAENAQKWLEIRDEMRVLESNSYIFQYENNDKQKEKISSRIAGYEEQITQFDGEVKKCAESLDTKMQEQSSLDEQLNVLRDEQTLLAVKEESIKGQGNTMLERRSGLLRTKQDYSKRLADLEDEFDNLNGKLRDFYAQQSMNNEEKSDLVAQMEEITTVHVGLVKDLLDRDTQIESKNAEIRRWLDSIGDIKGNIGKIKAEKQAALDKIADLSNEISELTSQIEKNEVERADLEEIVAKFEKEKNRLEKTKNELSHQCEEMREEMEGLRSKAEELKASISSNISRRDILEEMKKEYSGFGGGVRSLLKASDSNPAISAKLLGVVANIMQVPERLQTAIETALGGNIQNIVVEREEDAKFLISYLKQNSLGRVTFLPISSYKSKELPASLQPILRERGCLGVASKLIKYSPKFNSIFSGLLGSTLVCEDIDSAVAISRKYGYAVKIVTLQGEYISTSGSMAGGSAKSAASNVLSQENEIIRCKKAIDEDKAELKAAGERHEALKEELLDTKDQLKEYEENAKEASDKYIRENTKLETLISVLVEQNERKTGLINKKTTAEHNYETICEALAQVDKQDQSMKTNTSTVDDEARKSRDEYQQMKAKKEELDQQLLDLKVRIQALTVGLENIKTSIAQAEDAKKTLISNMNDCKSVLAGNESNIKATEAKLNNASVSAEDKKRYGELIAAIKKFTDRKTEITDEIRELNAKKDEASKNLLDAVQKKTQQEAALLNLQERMETLKNHIKEEYDLDYESAQIYRVEDFNFTAGQDRIKSLKASKNALGSVNLEAIDEVKVQQERYDEMHVQYEDLLKAEQDCVDIIAKLSKEILDKFNAEFARINENFKEVFKELFAGGAGELVVKDTEPGEDPLEAGIEIYAQPPGKKVQMMSLLSGGEQALTALAILFAILKLRPMPFCVLDELESALDEGNVGVYAKYLKKFAQGTQFVVITHRKPTMEMSDKLFGVTMQEQGVSKVVQVSFAEAAAHSTTAAERIE